MREAVREYYGQVLEDSSDLRTDACSTLEDIDPQVRAAMANIHPEVAARYYGCGMVVPEALDGLRILDLGCGAGRDCYLLAQLVGPQGAVVGVDMTAEQLEVARRHEQYHCDAFGYAKSNVSFLEGYLEALDELPLEPASFDLVISNCVINLCTDKPGVLQSVQRLLKPGGEMYFADVYADRRVPATLATDPVLYGECLSGALYWNDFLNLARSAGFSDARLAQWRPIAVNDAELSAKVAPLEFYSATWRLFNIDGLEPACEDYGHSATYLGSVQQHPERFDLDLHHRFPVNQPVRICGNTWRMLAHTRLHEHFELSGNFDQHLGLFEDCGAASPFADPATAAVAAGSCC